MTEKAKIAFHMEGVTVRIEDILPVKPITTGMKASLKFGTIKASIEEVGIIEPPIIYPTEAEEKGKNRYILLDGHLRIEVLKQLGEEEVFCLLSTDDEGFTYGDKVNRLSPIQEHYMILRAIKKGLSEERIAKALNVNVARIKEKRRMLKGICQEAIDILKDKNISPGALAIIKRVKPMRQIEIADLMVGLNNFSISYAQALVTATKQEELVEAAAPRNTEGLKPEDLERMKKEMESFEQDFREIETSYENNVMNLTLARGYLKRLLASGNVVRFLSSRYKEVLDEFNKIVESSPLEG